MNSQISGFGQLLNHLQLYSAQTPDIQLNSSFIFISRDRPALQKLRHSRQFIQQRQIPLKCIFQQMLSQQRMLSSYKLTPQKNRGIRKIASERKQVFKDIQIISTTKKSDLLSNQVDKQLEKNTLIQQDTQQTPKAAKLLAFKVLEDNQQKIKAPTVSQRLGCGWKQQPLVKSNIKSKWWNPCSQLCSGQNTVDTTDKYQFQTTQRQLNKLISNKKVPFSNEQPKINKK